MLLFDSLYSNYVKRQYIINAVNKLFIRHRTPKYNNEYLVDHILECNLNYTSWSKYDRHLKTANINTIKYHAKYLNEIYVKWSQLDIFKIAYANMLNDNYYYKNDCSHDLQLNTDVTCISNMCGIEKIGVNPEYIKKHVTKLAVLNTVDNVAIGVIIIDNKQILETHNTLCHDKTSIQPLLNNILIDINDCCNIKINGDKAYITSDTYVYKNNNIQIITPIRKKTTKQAKKQIKNMLRIIEIQELKAYKYKNNYGAESRNLINCTQKIQNMKLKIKQLNDYIMHYDEHIAKKKTLSLSKRYVIENYFCSLKHISKLYLRTDKKINTFMSTIYIGFMYNYKIIH